MLGSMVSMGGYWLVLMVLVVWMCVRIWRSSPAMAVVTFFFWPASVLALFSNWGDRDSDIRIPFALSLLTAGLVVFMAQRSVDKGIEEMALALSQQDIEEIRQANPDLAIQLEEARADFIADGAMVDEDGYLVEGYGDGELAEADAGYAHDGDGDGAGGDAGHADQGLAARDGAATDTAGPASVRPAVADSRSAMAAHVPAASAAQSRLRDPGEVAAARTSSLRMAVLALSWRLGRLVVEDAGATIAIPRGFRFAPRQTLVRLAWLRGVPLDADLAGWLVHERTDLAADDAWYVDVRFRRLEDVPAAPEATVRGDERALHDAAFVAELAYAVTGTRELPRQPQWDGSNAVATWTSEAGAEPLRASAARVLPNGLLVFSAVGLAAEHQELATRSVRLMAQRSAPLSATDRPMESAPRAALATR